VAVVSRYDFAGMVVFTTRGFMSVINQMLRDLDKQQPATAGSVTPVRQSWSGAPANRRSPFRPLVLLLLCLFVGWLLWPLLQERLQSEPQLQTLSSPQLQQTSTAEQATSAAAVSATLATEPPNSDTETNTASELIVEAPVVAAADTINVTPAPTLNQVATTETDSDVDHSDVTTIVSDDSRSAQPLALDPIESGSFSQQDTATHATSQVFAAAKTDLPNTALQPAQPSRMQVDKIQQDPKVLAAEQARQQLMRQVQQLLQQARQASQQGQWSETLALLQQIPPEYQSAQSWQLQANARQQLGDFQGALASWQQLLQLEPQLAQAWLGKALAHDQLAQLPQARAAYQQAYALPGLSAASRQFIQQRLAE
jgi:cytoskeletal protein RodZ